EVLKGPQGTLFGASSMGGVIHYVFNEPDLEKFGGKAQVGFEGIPRHGTGDSQHLVVNLPIARDMLGVRIEGFRIESPAYIDNVYREQKDVNTSRSEGERVAILWRPSEEFRAQLTSYYQRLLTANQPTMDVQPLTLRPTSGDLETAAKLPQSLQSKLFVNNLQLSYDFSAATLLSSTSLEKAHANIALDASNEYGVLFSLGGIPGNAALFREYNDSKKTTEELRLTSRTAGRIEWLVGYYYTDENATNPEFIDQYNAQGATHTPVLPGIVQASIASVLREHALYGDLTYHFGSAFDLQGGVRYDRVTQEYAQPYYIFGGAVGAPEQATATLSKTTYLGTARYHFDRDTMLYARIATGYRPGGPNDKPPTVVTQAVPATYQPDSLISYELGLKGALAARVLGYTVNAYRVEWKNIQALGFDAASGVNFNTNGGKAHSQGLEVSLDYLPLEGLRLGLSGSFGDAKLDEAVPLGSVTAHRGDELPYAPQVAFTGTIDYTHPLTASMNGFAGLTVAHVGSRRIFFAEQAPGIPQLGPEFVSPVGPLPAYTTVDLRAGITRDSVTLTAYARNLSNTRGALGAQNTLVGVDLAQGTVGPLPLSVIPPRTLGVTLQYDF